MRLKKHGPACYNDLAVAVLFSPWRTILKQARQAQGCHSDATGHWKAEITNPKDDPLKWRLKPAKQTPKRETSPRKVPDRLFGSVHDTSVGRMLIARAPLELAPARPPLARSGASWQLGRARKPGGGGNWGLQHQAGRLECA